MHPMSPWVSAPYQIAQPSGGLTSWNHTALLQRLVVACSVGALVLRVGNIQSCNVCSIDLDAFFVCRQAVCDATHPGIRLDARQFS